MSTSPASMAANVPLDHTITTVRYWPVHQRRDQPDSARDTTRRSLCAVVAVSWALIPPSGMDAKEEKDRRRGIVESRQAWRDDQQTIEGLTTFLSTSRSPLHARSEEDVRIVRIPLCEDPEMKVACRFDPILPPDSTISTTTISTSTLHIAAVAR